MFDLDAPHALPTGAGGSSRCSGANLPRSERVLRLRRIARASAPDPVDACRAANASAARPPASMEPHRAERDSRLLVRCSAAAIQDFCRGRSMRSSGGSRWPAGHQDYVKGTTPRYLDRYCSLCSHTGLRAKRCSHALSLYVFKKAHPCRPVLVHNAACNPIHIVLEYKTHTGCSANTCIHMRRASAWDAAGAGPRTAARRLLDKDAVLRDGRRLRRRAAVLRHALGDDRPRLPLPAATVPLRTLRHLSSNVQETRSTMLTIAGHDANKLNLLETLGGGCTPAW